ncbi:MAG: hypothetical protein OEU80_08080 [Deltaproteobacteria bacterium]|nr:hypothetical protein [Deltaproteobacteria bacterium]
MIIIWSNVIFSNGEVLLQVLVDGILWRRDDFGKMQAIFIMKEMAISDRWIQITPRIH